MGLYHARRASSWGFLFLSQRPFDVVVLESFLEFGGAMTEEFHKGGPNRLPFIAEPSRLHQSRQLLSNLFRQIHIY